MWLLAMHTFIAKLLILENCVIKKTGPCLLFISFLPNFSLIYHVNMCITLKHTKYEKVSEYDQEMPQSHTAP